MKINQTLSGAFALVMLAVTLGVAIGEPPPKEPPQPGFTVNGSVVMADCTDEHCLPGTKPKLVLADGAEGSNGAAADATHGTIHINMSMGDPDDGGQLRLMMFRDPPDPPVIKG
jgi:hypothetical protein